MRIVGYVLELCGGNGKENGNYYSYGGYIRTVGDVLELYRDNGKKMETIRILGII